MEIYSAVDTCNSFQGGPPDMKRSYNVNQLLFEETSLNTHDHPIHIWDPTPPGGSTRIGCHVFGDARSDVAFLLTLGDPVVGDAPHMVLV